MKKTPNEIITIQVDYEKEVITIITSSGIETTVEGVAIFGGDAVNQKVFNFLHGSSSDCAWAFREAFKVAHGTGLDDRKHAMKNFFKQSAAGICNDIDPDAFKNEAGNMWLDEDQRNWGKQDSEDVLNDKQIAEGKAKEKWTVH